MQFENSRMLCFFGGHNAWHVLDVCAVLTMLFEIWGKIFQWELLVVGNVMRNWTEVENKEKREENNRVTNACNVSVSI